MEKELLKLDDQICFALYASSREIIKRYTPVLDPIGLTYTQYIIFLALWEKDNIPVKELGGRLMLDSGTLTPVLKKLEARKLIERTRSRADERNVCITLTQAGVDLKEKALDIPEKIFCSTGLSMEQALALHGLLKQLLSGLCE